MNKYESSRSVKFCQTTQSYIPQDLISVTVPIRNSNPQNINPLETEVHLHNIHNLVHTTQSTPTALHFNHCALKSCRNATCNSKGNGKAIPLQAWGGPEGSRKLRFPDFMTTAQDGGKVVSRTHRLPLPPGNTPGTHFC